MKIYELVEGKEYKGKDYEANYYRYRKNGIYLEVFYDDEWSRSRLLHNKIVEMDFTELPQFTLDELALMKMMPDWAKWIALDADESCEAWIYGEEPQLYGDRYDAIGKSDSITVFSHIFITIKPGEKYQIIR